MLGVERPELGIVNLMNSPRFLSKLKSPCIMKTLVLYHQLVLKIIIFSLKRHLTNLNAGIGYACAGHWRLMALSSALVNLFNSVDNENLGLAPPIGSVKLDRFLKKIKGTPECRKGKTLSWTLKTNDTLFFSGKNQTFSRQWKFWLSTPNRFWKNVKISKNRSKSHLNAGRGNPWAGQANERENPILWTRWRAFVMYENFGFAPPIGSKKI